MYIEKEKLWTKNVGGLDKESTRWQSDWYYPFVGHLLKFPLFIYYIQGKQKALRAKKRIGPIFTLAFRTNCLIKYNW